MKYFKWIFKILLVLFLLVAGLGTAGYMRLQTLREPGHTAPYANAPKVYLFSPTLDLIQKEIEAAALKPDYVGYDESNIGIFIVLDWENLQNVPGLYEYCGELCASKDHLMLQRYVTTTNAINVRKDVFINMNDFVDYDREAQKISLNNNGIACLRETLRREISYLLPDRKVTLKCQQEGARKHVINGSTVSNSTWKDNIDPYFW
jgi:hypothetical protein